MKRLAIHLITMLLTFAVSLAGVALKPKAKPVSPEEREAEEYAVYSALLNVFHPNEDGKLILIQSSTESVHLPDTEADETRFIKEDLPVGISQETLDNFKSVNGQTLEVAYRLALKGRYLLIGKEERMRSFETQKSMQAFFQKYPQSGTIILLSRVGFNKTMDEALVNSWGYCGGLCGSGGYYLLKKENGVWKLKQEKTWES
jgi:hypothetical protein